MKKMARNMVLILLSALLVAACVGCDQQDASQGAAGLQVNTINVLPAAYLNEPYDLLEIILIDDGVEYSATAVQKETIYSEETGEFTVSETELEGKDMCFTPVSLNNTVVTITATQGESQAFKRITIGTTVRADALDDIYKSTGVLGYADAGISKSVNIDERYIRGENSATSLHVKFDPVI